MCTELVSSPSQARHLAPRQAVLFPSRRHQPRPAPRKFSLSRRRTREEVEFGLTPAAVWLLQYILEPALKKSRGAWTHINLTDLAARPLAPSRRALQEAVNRIERAGEAVGIKIRCEFSRGTPRLIFASLDYLKYDREPLFFKRDRITNRHLRHRCHTEDIVPNRFAYRQMLEASGILLSPHDPLKLTLIHCADSAPIPFSYLRNKQQHTPASRHERLRRLAWKVTQSLMQSREGHYDNCKITWNPRTAWNYAFKALRCGHDQARIVSCYDRALTNRHGLATDARQIWSPASTVTLARRLLDRDGLTEPERLAKMRAKLEAIHQEAVTDSKKTSAWFATRQATSPFQNPSAAVEVSASGPAFVGAGSEQNKD